MNNDSQASASGESFSVAITGSGGSGAVTAGRILLEAAAHCGFQGLMTRSAGPQIRGGESAAMVRFSPDPVECMGDEYDLLVALDWLNIERFADEIPLSGKSLILCDPAAGEVPALLRSNGAEIREVPFKVFASGLPEGRLNMVALGAAAVVCGLELSAMEASVRQVLQGKGEQVVETALRALGLGYNHDRRPRITIPSPGRQDNRWSITGNQACGLGALRGGVRFVAAYPITPASEILEWLAPRLEKLGGSLLQAEDELASINMIIGASFGGVPSLTATSGPGLSLMVEGLGLALVSETPVTVVNVMRGGPSTGIPTKSEQSDLNIALYGLHGDAPHLVLAPLSIRDAVFTTQWAVQLAEHLQTVSLVLSDQSLGQSQAIIESPLPCERSLQRAVEHSPGGDYRRYQVTPDDISAMALPGTPGGMYTADGLEHNTRGTPSSMAADHREQLNKRLRKLEKYDFGDDWAEVEGDGEQCIVTWGSSTGVVREAARRLRQQRGEVRVIALRLLAPLRQRQLRQALEGMRKILVVEQNHGAQLFHYLHAQGALPPLAQSLAQPGPLPLRPGRILRALEEPFLYNTPEQETDHAGSRTQGKRL
ncbi:MAG: 2-oxoacid:acceptor oxidoreductase subunit alpha [Candidatus Thiodiazotropha sp. (ex Dulcina madagascariensis)]|nr:2-oxoacid:acceptor oxidoreductase subunit alpha [Candidatus Thiodiazotropha sp. (ex Dulcina madagascariensis)]MCU7926616.1 2-oxoacid:acceptor oxidoreductase subunit alpha [Candidatus Thiodiazotropha sp. (ex Dulcina madagascariensis)]